MHPVISLLHDRQAAGTRPHHRVDDARLALVLEGGSSRAAYGGGMVCELESRGLLPAFDAVYGSSAGALNGAWLICGRANQYVHGWWDPEVMNQIIDLRAPLRRKPIVDTDRLVHHIYEQVTPMGFAEILASDVEYHPIGTDAETGESVDLAPFIHDKATLQAALRATSRMPVLGGPPVQLGERRYIDAGVAEPIPVQTALAQGATHVLVLRTKAPSTELVPGRRLEDRVVARWMARHSPGAAAAWAGRAQHKLQVETLMATDDRVLQVFPPADAPRISRVGRAESAQRQAVQIGRDVMTAALGSAQD